VTCNSSCLAESQDKNKINDKTKNQDDLSSRKCKFYQIFFLMNDANQNVEVLEVPEIEFEEVIGCLEQGDSVFITCR